MSGLYADNPGRAVGLQRDNPTVRFFLDPDNVDGFMQHVASGGRVDDFCREFGLNPLHWMRLVEEDAVYAEHYFRACRFSALVIADDVRDTVGLVRSGEVSASEGRTMMAGQQWVAEKNHGDRYGPQRPAVTGGRVIDMSGGLERARARLEPPEGSASNVARLEVLDGELVDGDDGVI